MSDSLADPVLLAHIAYRGVALCGAELLGIDSTGRPQCEACAWAAIDALCAVSVDRDALAAQVEAVRAALREVEFIGDAREVDWSEPAAIIRRALEGES